MGFPVILLWGINQVFSKHCNNACRDNYGTHYGEFSGSYAQDVLGYSDDIINDAFEGDPDAYWNIDWMIFRKFKLAFIKQILSYVLSDTSVFAER